MNMIRCLIVGSGGREASIVEKLKNDCKIFAFISHENPTIISAVQTTGGEYRIGNILDGQAITNFAIEYKVDLGIVNNDNSLAAGVVDYLKQASIPTFGPTKEGAKIEWSKTFSRKLVESIDSAFNPKFAYISSVAEFEAAFEKFQDIDVVVKPDGLTGGKGVKVVGEHLKDTKEAMVYAKEILEKTGKVLLEEKIDGYEFTIMGFTDGINVFCAPVTYDYPFRLDDDKGPGTGGMGCFTTKEGLLPFLNSEDFQVCQNFMQAVIRKLNENGIIFNGVLNGGFFKTKEGSLKLMEFNSRIGDPECLNIMNLLKTPLINVIQACIETKLSIEICEFYKLASIVVYLVTKDYGFTNHAETAKFIVDEKGIIEGDAHIIFGSSKKSEDGCSFISVGNSRLAAIVMTGEDLPKVREKTYQLIDQYVNGSVEYRKDIASDQILSEMKKFLL